MQKKNIGSIRQQAQDQIVGQGLAVNNRRVQQFVNDTANINQYAPIMTEEQVAQSNAAFEKRANILVNLAQVEDRYKDAQNG